jgi:PAS domain S-box-containing protein
VIAFLRERESRCRTILESQPGLICRIGPDMTLTYTNPAFSRLAGIPVKDLTGTRFSDHISGDDRDTFLDAVGKLTPERSSCTLALRLDRPPGESGSPVWTEWTFTAVVDNERLPVVIHGTGKDISWEREHAARQERKLENLAFLSRTAMEFVDMEDTDNIFQFIAEKIQALLPHSVVGVMTHDPVVKTARLESVAADEDVVSAFREWFGTDMVGMVFNLDQETYAEVDYTKKGIIEGPPLYYFLLHRFPEEACRCVEEGCSLGKTYVMGFSCHGRRFGSVALILRRGTEIENPELLEAFVNQASVALLRWQTRKAAEEEVVRVHASLEQQVDERMAELQAANRNLESFSFSVSHDLRAPLRSIEGFSGIFLQQYGKDLPPEARRLIEKVRQSTVRMSGLIDAILTFSRSTRKELRREEVDMQALVRNVLGEQIAARPGQKVEPVITSLPACRADPVLLRQVLENLLSNALKFSRTREVSRIEVGSFPEDGHIVYYVRDNGIGFDMAHAERVFRVFERVHDGTSYEGTGIGLAIADQIVRRHGGRIWVESVRNEGSTFYLTLGRRPGEGEDLVR